MSAWTMDATELLAAFRDRSLSPVEALDAVLGRAAAVNGTINALFDIRPDEARAAAIASEARWQAGAPLGPLDGIPITIKDSVAAAGRPYWRGVAARRNDPPSTVDSPPAARLREAGAVVFAKTTMPDFGLSSSGVSSAHGITRNPHDPSVSTGGSSAGAGAAVAAGLGPLAIGTDLAGSVRLPAGHCGVVGFKPSFGRVPHLPASRLRVAGPLARSVADAALLLGVMAQPDPRVPAVPLPPLGTALDPSAGLGGVRIGLLLDMGFGLAVEPEVAAAVSAAAERLAAEGAVIVPLRPAFAGDPLADADRYYAVKAAQELAGFSDAARDGINPTMRRYAESGAAMSALDYLAHGERLEAATTIFGLACADVDLVLTPVITCVAFPAEWLGADPARPLAHLGFTLLVNLLGWPAAAVPGATSTAGLPIGVQLIGKAGEDAGVLHAAAVLEAATPRRRTFPLA